MCEETYENRITLNHAFLFLGGARVKPDKGALKERWGNTRRLGMEYSIVDEKGGSDGANEGGGVLKSRTRANAGHRRRCDHPKHTRCYGAKW